MIKSTVEATIAQAEPEVADTTIKKVQARKPKKVATETVEEEKDHFAVFQKQVARGKVAAAIKAFRKALAKDVHWKEIKKLTLGQAAIKFYWHEDAQIKDFLHKLREMVGDKGAAIAGETLHEWTARISQLAIEQAEVE